MTEQFPDPNSPEAPDDLPTRRRRRAETVPGSETQWWNSPPAGAAAEGPYDGLAGSAAVEAGDAAWARSFDSDSYDADGYQAAGSGEGEAGGFAGPGGTAAAAVREQAPVATLPPLPAGKPDAYAAGEAPVSPGWDVDPVDYAAPEPQWTPEPLGMPEPQWTPETHQPESRAQARSEHGRQHGRRASFLDLQPAAVPAARGIRGLLTGMGMRLAPSARELEERRDMRSVSRHWPGPRTISVVNGKGGANKTPTTVMLAAVFARNGGGPVLAWDNNETRGTLGWRTEQGPHEATVMDLLPQTADLLSPSAQSALLARFVHHQVEDKFDVLRSKPDVLASEQKITAEDFDALHEVASKYFRLNIVDSGNDESAERWLRMIDHTDQLVIATTTVEEHAEAGALLLEALQARGGRYAELARDAVVIVSQSDRNGTDNQARTVAEGFSQLARAAVTIPYDPALRKGQIRYESLKPVAQRAWLAAAAAVADGL